ncbi:MAG: ectonucleotide pyrophosphatase/phosphodiesterase [Bacteroidota bacterium]
MKETALFGLLPLFFVLFQGCISEIQAQKTDYAAALNKEIVSTPMENTEKAKRSPYVILVSIDGFRYDYAEKHGASNILEIAKNGSHVKWFIPSFPSKTFPNHYTLVTGLYPKSHGIVGNTFYDPEFDEFYRIRNRKVVKDGSWYGGIPLWNLAQMQGMCAASYYWVGSEANINGMHPKYYYIYQKQTPYEFRVRRVLEWLALPENERPHMITLYFSLVDTVGHTYGPEAKEIREAVQYVDEQIGALRSGIAKTGLPVYLIVTSDHGMQEVTSLININQYVAVDRSRFVGGPAAMIYTTDQEETDHLYNVLSKKEFFRVYRKQELPDYLNYGNNPRIGELVLIAEPPYSIAHLESGNTEMAQIKADHGFDPYTTRTMGGILYIEGPNVKKGYVLPPSENIHLYPLAAQILGLKVGTPIDGRLEVLQSVLEK